MFLSQKDQQKQKLATVHVKTKNKNSFGNAEAFLIINDARFLISNTNQQKRLPLEHTQPKQTQIMNLFELTLCRDG